MHVAQIDNLIRRQQSWAEFFLVATALPEKAPGLAPDKGKVFERLTQLYLQTNPEYRSKLRHVWNAQDDLPAGIRTRLLLPSNDEGIDLIAETFSGQLWAIQCKFRSNTDQALTVTELSTFTNLSFNICRDVALAIVVHTCAKPVRKRNLLGNTTEIGLDRWLEINEEEWKSIQAATTGTALPLTPRIARKHQQDAVSAAKTHFVDNGAALGKLLMPCGTGKSLTAFWISQTLNARSTVIAVPSLSLIKQSLSDWTREYLAHGEIPDWLCICSDDTTANLDRDEFVSEVYDLGIEVTTKVDDIRKFLVAENNKRKVVFVTYQSGAVLVEAAKPTSFVFDLGIFDEAHRTVGAPDKSFAQLVSRENFAIHRRIFMTATERVVRGGGDEILSMDDPDTYGTCFYELNFKQAIESAPPIICDYKILTVTVSDSQVRQLIQENRYLFDNDQVMEMREAQPLAAGIALQRAFKEYGVKHAISFHRSIRASELFCEQQTKISMSSEGAQDIECFQISSKKTTGERARLLQSFRESDTALVTNARCLQEGVDVPAVDCVLFADPKQSVVDIVQAAGRAMRPHPGKEFGYIVVPIVVPDNLGFEEFAETTDFRQIARIITALSTQDDRIAEELRAVQEGRRVTGNIIQIAGSVPLSLNISFETFGRKIALRLWERVGKANWRPFAEARDFARSLGIASKGVWEKLCEGRLPGKGNIPADIPRKPDKTYAGKGWQDYGDWLGTGAVATNKRVYRPFEEAREFARSLNLEKVADWPLYCKGKLSDKGALPNDIPVGPNLVYKGKGWISHSDWIGTANISTAHRTYRKFSEARLFARSLGLRSVKDWYEYSRSASRPPDIPAAPWKTYKDEYIDLSDWLDIPADERYSSREFLPFSAAREVVHALGLKTTAEWNAYSKGALPGKPPRPRNIPASPNLIYKNAGWQGMPDWLGTMDGRRERERS